MSEQYTAVAYCPNTGMALTSGDRSFYMDPVGHITETFKQFPQSAVLKHHYIELRPLSGSAAQMIHLFNKLEAKLGDLEDIDAP